MLFMLFVLFIQESENCLAFNVFMLFILFTRKSENCLALMFCAFCSFYTFYAYKIFVKKPKKVWNYPDNLNCHTTSRMWLYTLDTDNVKSVQSAGLLTMKQPPSPHVTEAATWGKLKKGVLKNFPKLRESLSDDLKVTGSLVTTLPMTTWSI